jgi:hypothetical protein
MYFVFDSNIVRTNTSWVLLFSGEPKIGHCAYLTGYSRNKVSLFLARSVIKSTWEKHDAVYLAPKEDKK